MSLRPVRRRPGSERGADRGACLGSSRLEVPKTELETNHDRNCDHHDDDSAGTAQPLRRGASLSETKASTRSKRKVS